MVANERSKKRRMRTKARMGRMWGGFCSQGTQVVRSKRLEETQPLGPRALECLECSLDGAHHFFGRRHLNFQGFFCQRMGPREVRATEVESMSNVNRRRPVHRVPHDGVADGSSMSSDLVGSTCAKGPFHEAGCAMHTPRTVAQTTKVCET